MVDFPYKIDIIQDTANKVKCKEVPLNLPAGKNAFRIESMTFQVDDFDAVADLDDAFLQLSYLDQEGNDDVEVISSDDEIITITHLIVYNGTPAVIDTATAKLRQGGIYIDEFNSRLPKYIVEKSFFACFGNSGQDAVETAHVEIQGKAVRLDEETISRLRHPHSIGG